MRHPPWLLATVKPKFFALISSHMLHQKLTHDQKLFSQILFSGAQQLAFALALSALCLGVHLQNAFVVEGNACSGVFCLVPAGTHSR